MSTTAAQNTWTIKVRSESDPVGQASITYTLTTDQMLKAVSAGGAFAELIHDSWVEDVLIAAARERDEEVQRQLEEKFRVEAERAHAAKVELANAKSASEVAHKAQKVQQG